MKMKFPCLLFLLLLAVPQNSNAQPSYKTIEIDGTSVFEEEYIISKLHLDRYPAGEAKQYRKIAAKINEFYLKQNYALVRSYLIHEDNESIKIFVDEGKLGQIIIKNLDTIKTLRFKIAFDLPHKVYNTKLIEKERNSLKKKYGYKRIQIKLVPAKNYNDSLFQLDDIYQVPLIGESQIPFFDRYGYRYNLIIEIESPEKTGRIKASSFTYGIDFFISTGFVPFIAWDRYRLFAPRDHFKFKLSMGIKYLVDLKPKNKPTWVYNRLNSQYTTRPFYKDKLHFRISTDINHTRNSRPDLGMTTYTYGLMNTAAEPGVSLMRELKLYTGAGVEKIYIFNIDYDPLKPNHPDVRDTIWKYLQTSLELQNVFWGFKTEDTPVIKVNYAYYWQGNSFHQFKISFNRSFAVRNASFFENRIEYEYLHGEVPFYHDTAVNGGAFRGLSGRNYYTHNSVKMGNAIKTSIYRDFIFIGIFGDLTAFEGSGFDLSGKHYGGVTGPSLSAIFLDQFQGEIYYGRDILLPEIKYGNNLFFSFSKKW